MDDTMLFVVLHAAVHDLSNVRIFVMFDIQIGMRK